MKRFVVGLLMLSVAAVSVTAQVPAQPTLPPPDPAQPAPLQPAPPDAAQPAPPAAPALSRTCPAQVTAAFNAARLICENLQDGQACLGNGIVETTARTEGAALAQPADRRPITDFTSLRLRTLDTENGLLTVVAARPRLLTVNNQLVNVLMIAFGDVTVTDDADVVQEVTGQRSGRVIADFGLNIRRGPDGGADLLWQLRPGESVTVTGRLADRSWVRVVIPNGFGTPGWVYAPYLEIAGGIETVPVVDVNTPAPTPIAQQTPEFTTMQAFIVSSRDVDPSCADAPNSGLLLQSPDGLSSRVRTRINKVLIEFNGTLFIRSQPNASFSAIVLEGEARFIADNFRSEAVSGLEVIVSVDGQSQATSAPVPDTYDASLVRHLPVSLLGRLVALPAVDLPEPTPQEAAATEEPTPEEVTAVEEPPTLPDALPTPVVPAETIPDAPPVTGSLTSAATGELCGAAPATLTEPASPVGTITDVGGIWRATAGTTATFEVSGGTFQPSFNNFIRLNAVTGIVAQSGDQRVLTHTFQADTAFSASFSSQAGETLTVTVRCGS
ncbi:SH3 domain-containing protein [Aggregatilineales bacterium SYSU G02658]